MHITGYIHNKPDLLNKTSRVDLNSDQNKHIQYQTLYDTYIPTGYHKHVAALNGVSILHRYQTVCDTTVLT